VVHLLAVEGNPDAVGLNLATTIDPLELPVITLRFALYMI
jgi:hypothetical protein